jgi:hypothetical protein
VRWPSGAGSLALLDSKTKEKKGFENHSVSAPWNAVFSTNVAALNPAEAQGG